MKISIHNSRFACRHIPRRFDLDPADEVLLEELRSLAREYRQLFGLGGYAWVDFRVDHRQRPWIPEINANPCLSPDAGLAAANRKAGLGLDAAVGVIVEAGGF